MRIKTLAEIEKQAIIYALYKFEGNKKKAATALGISRGTIYALIRKHKIDEFTNDTNMPPDPSDNADLVCELSDTNAQT